MTPAFTREEVAAELVRQDATSPTFFSGFHRRWFIRMGNPGFNSRANNSRGYHSEWAALCAISFYRSKSRRPRKGR